MSDSGRADALLADLPRDGRGRLKIFLGAAPGVGKTYAMLQAAHTQLRQGVKSSLASSKPTAARRLKRCSAVCRSSRWCARNTEA